MTHIIYHPIITIKNGEVHLAIRNLILNDGAINVKMSPKGNFVRCHESPELDDSPLEFLDMIIELDGDDE